MTNKEYVIYYFNDKKLKAIEWITAYNTTEAEYIADSHSAMHNANRYTIGGGEC